MFEKKELTQTKRVCVRLREFRESQHLSIADVSRRTHISPKYLEAIEQCRFSDIPFGLVYQKNFVKRFATALGLPGDKFLSQFLEEEMRYEELSPTLPKKKVHRSFDIPQIIRIVGGSLCLLLLVVYLGFQVKKSIDPPHLFLYSPPNGFVARSQTLVVEGKTDQETNVSINGETIILHPDGKFSEHIYLSPGINTIVVSAKKKHGKTTIETRHVILKENKQVMAHQ